MVFYAVAVFALWLLALGPEPEWSTPWRALVFGPYRLLIELPGAQSIRVPARAWLPAVLSLAMLAGFGTVSVLRRYPRHPRALVGLLALLIVTEGWFFDGTMAAPRPMRQGAIPEGAVVLDLPIEDGFAGAAPQYRAVVGGYRTVNGYSGYEPAHYYPLRRAIADFQPDALDRYRPRRRSVCDHAPRTRPAGRALDRVTARRRASVRRRRRTHLPPASAWRGVWRARGYVPHTIVLRVVCRLMILAPRPGRSATPKC